MMPVAMTYTSLLADLRRYLERGSLADPSVYEQLPSLVNLAERRCAQELKIQGFIQSVTATFSPGNPVVDKPNRWRETVSMNYGTGKNTVASVTITAGGAGYLAPPVVTFTGGAGTGAAATAVITDGVVTDVLITDGGQNYTSAPTVTFTLGDGIGATGTAVRSTEDNQRNMVLPRSYEYCRSYWPDDSQTGNPLFYADYDYQHFLIVPTPVRAFPFELVYWEQPVFLDDVTQTNWLTEYAPNLLLYASLLEASPFLKADERIQTWQALYDRTAQAVNGEDLRKIIDRAQRRKDA
jgi:hypothetical protein